MAQNVAITAGSGTSIAADLITGDASLGTADVQYVKVMDGTIGGTSKQLVNADGSTLVRIADSLGAVAYNHPAGFLRVTDEPRQILYDPFDAALDTTNIWTTPTVGNSAVLASVTTGVLSMGTGTTASGWSKLFSANSFKPVTPAWIGYSFAISMPDGAAPTANSYRFWGAGTIPTTPTTAAPLTDAVGFELTTTGKLFAVVYAGGVRTAIQDLSSSGNSKQVLDALVHRYVVYIRTDKAYWYIDTLSAPVATSSAQGPQVQTLPITMLAVGGSTPPGSNTQIQCSGLAVWDTGKNTSQISDGVYPWRKATVKAASTAALATDPALVVSVSPNNGVKVTDGTNTAKITSATNLLAATNNAAVISEKGPRWNVTSTPAVSTKASASKAAGGAGVSHVCDAITFSAGSTTAPALTQLTVNLRDGATGAGTVIWSYTVIIGAATGQNVPPVTITGLNLVGSANTAMTLEWSALVTNLFETCSLSGFDVS